MLESIKRLFVAFLVGLILCPPSMVHAAGITPDATAPQNNQATMDTAQNGVPVVKIATPNGSGLSHNKFSNFNVESLGVIFNNATTPGVSQLGGALAPNASLGGHAASTILSEVTGTGRTSIGGYIEIFGHSANFILANPNGISINGGGVINTPKATMTTGIPQFSGDALLGLTVRGGDILVEGAGLNASNVDAFELITRTAQINADIYAKKLNVVTGQNQYDPASETTTPLTPDGSITPSIAIDSSALGGMYAGRIKLVATEAGVGVNTHGIVQASDNLVMTADGKVQIKNSVSSAQDLSIASNNDELAISGAIKAVGTASLAGKVVTVAPVEVADAPVLSAETVAITTETLSNDGLVAADQVLSVAANDLTNTGTLYSGNTGLFNIYDTLWNNQGYILSVGDSVFEGSVTGSRMATLQNDSGNIESFNGKLLFRADTFLNNNAFFSLVEGSEVLSYEEGAYWRSGHRGKVASVFTTYVGRAPEAPLAGTVSRINVNQLAAVGLDTSRNVFSLNDLTEALNVIDTQLADDPTSMSDEDKLLVEQVRSLADEGKSYYGTIVGRTDGFIFAATTTRDTATGQDLGSLIAANGDIDIDADTAKNNVSAINSATGDININATTFTNVGQSVYERASITWGRAIFHSHQSPNIIPTGGGTEVVLTPIDYAYGSLDAGGKVNISSGVAANGVIERNGVYAAPDAAAQQQKVDDVTAVTSLLPSDGLFQSNTDPAHNYTIETNPALTNLGTFFGSEYALTHMGIDPNVEANKRLGDAYYETTLVREQLLELTGRRFLGSGMTSDTDQMLALMDNASAAKTDLGLTVGIALSNEQIAALTSDIVWFEYREVDGEQVLVPVVYLCSSSLNEIIQDGSAIVAAEVDITASESLVNAGLIQSKGELIATADTIFNNGTVAGQNVGLTASDSIYNTGGTVQGSDVSFKAEKNVVLAAETTEFKGKGTTYSQKAKDSKIESTGNVSIEAGEDLALMGTDVKAAGDTTLKATGNVAITTVETSYTSKNKGSGYKNNTDSTYNHKSTVETAGNLKVEAGKDATIHGSQLSSSGDTDIKAGGDVAVTAATDSTNFHSYNKGGGGSFGGGSKSTKIDMSQKTVVASSIKSGEALSVEAGTTDTNSNLSVVGSKLQAEGDLKLHSANELLISSGEEEKNVSFDESNSGLLSSKLTKAASGSVTQVASEVISNSSVDIQAKADVTVSASNVHGDQGVAIKSDTGDVRIAGGQNQGYSEREEKKSGIGLFVSKGRLDVAKFSEESVKSEESGNAASQITSGTDTTITAANDATIIGSTVAAENDVNITAGRDANIIPGRNSQSSQKSSKEGGIGIGLTLSENEISVSAGYKGVQKKTNTSGEYNAGSLVSAGNDVNVEAGRNINQVTSDVEAGQDVSMKAGEDLKVTAAQDVEHLDEYVKSVEVGIKLAAKQSVSTAVRTLAETPKNMTSGEGGAGAKAVTAGSGALQAVSAAQQVTNPSASVSLTAGLSMSESTFSSDTATSVSSRTAAGRDIALEADKDLTVEGSKVQANEDIALTAGEDVSISSGKNSQETSSSSNSISASVGIGATVSAANGAAAGVQVSGAASGSDSDYRSDSNTNAQVVAGQDLTVKSGQDTTVAGANIDGNKVNMDVGDNLVVASKQDTSKSKNSNWSIGGTATVGAGASAGLNTDSQTGDSANIGMGQGSGSSAWVHNQTSIIGKEQVDIRVEKNTHVEGAVIAAENGNLKLDTDTLSYKDIHDHDKASNYQVSASVSKSAENEENSKNRQDSDNKQVASSQEDDSNDDEDADQVGTPYAGTLDGSASSHDRRQVNRATIGEGEIIIRSDPAAGLEGLNRDLAKAQEITKDEKTSVTVYIDTSAIEEVASGFKGIQENTKKTATAVNDLIEDLKGKEQLTPAEVTWLKDGILDILKESKIFGSDELAEGAGEYITNSVTETYESLRKQGFSNSEALNQIAKSFAALEQWTDKGVQSGFAIKSVNGKLYFDLPKNNGTQNVFAGVDDVGVGFAALVVGASIALVYAVDPEAGKQMADALYNTFEEAKEKTSEFIDEQVDYYQNLSKESPNTILVNLNLQYAIITQQIPVTVAFGDGIRQPSAVKFVNVGDEKMLYDVSGDRYYSVESYDQSTGTISAFNALKMTTIEPGGLGELIETYPDNSGSNTGWLEIFPIDVVKNEIEVLVPVDPDKDGYTLIYPDSSGENKTIKHISPDMSGEMNILDYVLLATSVNQMQKKVESGQAPPTIDRVENGMENNELKPHVHFKDGSSIYRDGTWRHGNKKLTNKEKKWLSQNGWRLPNE